MIISDQRRNAIKEKLGQKIDVAVSQGLSDGTSPGLKAALDEVESYSKLLASTEPSWTRDSGAALAVAIIVILAAGFLWSCSVTRTNISLTAETDRLHAVLARDWSLEDPLKGKGVRLDHLSALHNPSLGLSLDDGDGNIWFRLVGEQVVVQTLQVSRNASTDVISSKDGLGLSISRAPFRGTIWVVGKGTLTAGTAEATTIQKSYDLPIPETLEFAVQKPRAASAELDVRDPQPWSLGMVPCSDLSFNYELRSLGDREVLSGIRSGTLQFNDTSWPTTQLVENQILSVPKTDGARIQIRSAKDVMHVTIDGLVGHVALGDAERRREFAPSYLEYLYNKKSLLLFCAAVTAGWGLLWGIRKTIFR